MGLLVGLGVGLLVGLLVGLGVGALVGLLVGSGVGLLVGLVGFLVGEFVLGICSRIFTVDEGTFFILLGTAIE